MLWFSYNDNKVEDLGKECAEMKEKLKDHENLKRNREELFKESMSL